MDSDSAKFLFPSTGKAFLNEDVLTAETTKMDGRFLFPSTGKAFLNNKRNLRQQDH